MYLGKLVELASADEVYERPIAPYTEALLSAIPIPDPGLARNRNRIVLAGTCPPDQPADSCHFHPRCRYANRITARSSRPSSTTETGTWRPAAP